MSGEWLPATDAVPIAGVEIVIRLKNPDAAHADVEWWGKSVHQIARWDDEGRLWSRGRHVPAVTLIRLLKERPELIPVVERISGEG